MAAPIVDTHFHLWRRSAAAQAGILAAPYLQRDALWSDYEAAVAGLGVERSVNVQVNDRTDPLPEVRFVSEVAAGAPRIGCMVAWCHLDSARAGPQLDALRKHPLVAGVRRSTQHETDAMLCAREPFVTGAALLPEHGYLCELCVKGHQLEGVAVLAESLPEVTFVLDHLGKPDLGAGDQSVWRSGMTRLGRLPNVACKVSVVVHADSDPPLTRALAEPIINHALATFGWDRVMFGSNWPVSLAVTGYAQWVEVVDGVLARERFSDLGRLWSANARRVYRL